jgi:hypothetical protein
MQESFAVGLPFSELGDGGGGTGAPVPNGGVLASEYEFIPETPSTVELDIDFTATEFEQTIVREDYHEISIVENTVVIETNTVLELDDCYSNQLEIGEYLSSTFVEEDILIESYPNNFYYNDFYWEINLSDDGSTVHRKYKLLSVCREYISVEHGESLMTDTYLHWSYNDNQGSYFENYDIYHLKTVEFILAIKPYIDDLEDLYNLSFRDFIEEGVLIFLAGVALVLDPLGAPVLALSGVSFVDQLMGFMVANELETFDDLYTTIIYEGSSNQFYDTYITLTMGRLESPNFEHGIAEQNFSNSSFVSILQNIYGISYVGELSFEVNSVTNLNSIITEYMEAYSSQCTNSIVCEY